MLTEDEQRFIDYWEEKRLNRKRFLKQLLVGLPLGVIFVVAIFANFLSGWYKRAQMVWNTDLSLVPVLLCAAILITGFIAVFSARHKWEMNEQRYRELLSKKDNP